MDEKGGNRIKAGLDMSNSITLVKNHFIKMSNGKGEVDK